ncbi:2-dehydro-3-deoxygalactonokinase [Ruegeria sediminis]|uniref:2-dehydro-3-deoxygalactonokinase n=1 Tax=Ruegeria sediminis TaxID=2583820 RepID=A0ABY2WTV8_9RHOB|nr:2-dehydro-3-deoxygalactonokinase [Ruegeria sediminis]TMV04205.1 2-dehydro-3-deoxygalactonokinase [Ruegeria sediminis]
MTKTRWIAADWGTTNLRLWAFDHEGQVSAERVSDQGMGQLKPDEFERVFIELAGDLLGQGPCDVVICGMAGARQGWAEAPYAKVPSAPIATDGQKVRTNDPRLNVCILPGLSQANPPDVMRGEETQIAGYLKRHPEFQGSICLPGTHTKWVRIDAGKVVHFRTFMTGELFALLSKQSVLRHGIGDGWNSDAFTTAVGDALSAPDQLTASLFALRATALVSELDPDAARARLSGCLIGAELAGARPFWQGRNVVLIGDPSLCAHYSTALGTQSCETEYADARTMTLAGLAAAHARMTGAEE